MKCIEHYNQPMNEHSIEYNTTFKIFPDGTKKVKYHNYSSVKGIFRGRGVSTKQSSEKKRYENLYNSKQRLIDLVYCNSLVSPWEYFVTLTFNPEKVDSFDYQKVVDAMHKWLDNMKHQNKDLKFILVPELHKSGRIHIHGLFKNCPNLDLVDSGYTKNGCIIYNINNYDYGFTTVSEIKNQEAVSVYMAKYMTKDLINISGRHTYWRSRDLEKPKIEYAHLNEDTLQFYINKNEIKDYYSNEKSIFFTFNDKISDTFGKNSQDLVNIIYII